MLKIIRIFIVTAVFIKSSLTSNLNQTTDHSPTENTTTIPPNHRMSAELIDKSDFLVNASLVVAEPRQFPVGDPDLIPSTSNLVSPFDVATFGQQLLPLINVNIKEKVKDLARTFNDGADYIEDAIRESWRESPLNPHNFKHLLETPNILKRLPHTIVNSLRKPIVHFPKASYRHREKAPKSIGGDGAFHEYGIHGYKHFEESILRELEKQEELKVEATIHTLFEQGDRVKIIQGKPYDFKSGWKPVAAPTKIYDDGTSGIHSQIVSPLHTSFYGSTQYESDDEPQQGFHDFDHLNGNSVHSTYSVQEEEGESKVKPVNAKISAIRHATPSTASRYTETSTEKSSYRKRHNIKAAELESAVPDSGFSGSHDAPTVINKTKRTIPKLNVLSLTTSRPVRTYTVSHRPVFTVTPKPEVSTKGFSKFYNEASQRFRTSTTSTTTIKPSRNVPRETTKFLDKPKITGFRGSVKFGQTTTQKPPV